MITCCDKWYLPIAHVGRHISIIQNVCKSSLSVWTSNYFNFIILIILLSAAWRVSEFVEMEACIIAEPASTGDTGDETCLSNENIISPVLFCTLSYLRSPSAHNLQWENQKWGPMTF